MLETLLPVYITSNDYLYALSIVLIFFFVTKLIVWIVEKYIMALTARTKTTLDDELVKCVNKPISFIILLIGIKLALKHIGLEDNILLNSQRIIMSIVMIVSVATVMAIIKILTNHWSKRAESKPSTRIDSQVIVLFKRFAKLVVIILAILFALGIWGVEIGPLLASLGIVGIAVAFALQSTLGNIFGGMSMMIDRSIKVGDIIKIDSGEMGTVFDVGLRSTRIKTFDNEVIILPNGKLAESKIHNFVLPDPSIRVNVEFGVEYGADPEFVKVMAVEEVKQVKDVMKEPAPLILFTAMGDNALLFKIMFWVNDMSKKWPTHQEAITRIYRRLYKEKIGIPFPQRTVWSYNAGKAPNHSPFDKKYTKYNTKHNITQTKNEGGKNPEEKDTRKISREAIKESEKKNKDQ